MVEFDAELPGTSQLNIKVMDKNTIGFDALIGTTVIDLEDRWYVCMYVCMYVRLGRYRWYVCMYVCNFVCLMYAYLLY